MEPKLTTAASLQSVLEELSARKPLFHRPEFGTTRAEFEAMTAPDFWEIGASGRIYSRDSTPCTPCKYATSVAEFRLDNESSNYYL
jgi:hypothetical protein